MKPDNLDPLDDLIGSWQVELPTPTEFNRRVWQQIAVDRADIHWAELLLSWLIVPRRLIAATALAIIFGMLTGFAVSKAHQAEGKHAYFSAIDPLSKDHAPTHLSQRQP